MTAPRNSGAARAAQAEPAVLLSDLSAGYAGHGPSPACTALAGVSVRLEPGEVLGVLGSAGSGKSSLLRLLSGRADAAPPVITGGSATVEGRRLGRMSRRRRAEHGFHVGYLSQSAGRELAADRTAAETIAEPILSRDRRFNRVEAGRRVAELVEAVDLPLSVMDAYPYELSGGQRQRVALAAALVLGPRILLADEPVAAVDPGAAAAVIDLLGRLRRTPGFSAVIVNHDPRLLRRVADRILVLDEGRMIGYGPIETVLEAPTHPYVRALAAEFARTTS